MDKDNRDKKPVNRDRKPFDRAKKPFGGDKKPADREKRSFDGEKKPFSRDRKPFDRDRKPFGGDKKPFPPRTEHKEGAGKGFDPRTDKKPFDPRTDRKPFVPGADKKPSEPGRKPEGRPMRGGPRPGQPRPAQALPEATARGVALLALNEVYSAGAYTNLALDKRLKAAKLSDEDKRLATSIFYLCVENRIQIEYILAPFIQEEPDVLVKCMLHIACAQMMYMDRIPVHAAVNEAVNQTKSFKHPEATGFVNGVLRSLQRALDAGEVKLPEEDGDQIKYISVKYSVSEYVAGLLIDAFGYETAKLIAGYRHPEHYETGRPNLLRTDNEGFEAYLNEKGIEWKHGRVPGSYRLSKAGNPAQNPDYLRGLFSLQGESAMLAALAVEPKRGMSILDACAAPGGKSAYMCELMQGSGRVYAWDLHEHRADIIKSNGKRLGLDNLRTSAKDATEYRSDLEGAFDAVLIDAPCSGLGVMADKPDIKYNMTAEKLEDIMKTQKQILAACSQYVKKGGLLVYSTCSVLPQENEKQVREFLLVNPDFRVEAGTDYLPEEFRQLSRDGMITLQQYRDDVEGFFIARMRRV